MKTHNTQLLIAVIEVAF